MPTTPGSAFLESLRTIDEATLRTKCTELRLKTTGSIQVLIGRLLLDKYHLSEILLDVEESFHDGPLGIHYLNSLSLQQSKTTTSLDLIITFDNEYKRYKTLEKAAQKPGVDVVTLRLARQARKDAKYPREIIINL